MDGGEFPFLFNDGPIPAERALLGGFRRDHDSRPPSTCKVAPNERISRMAAIQNADVEAWTEERFARAASKSIEQ